MSHITNNPLPPSTSFGPYMRQDLIDALVGLAEFLPGYYDLNIGYVY